MNNTCPNPPINRDWALPLRLRAWLHVVDLTGEWPERNEADSNFLKRVKFYEDRPWLIPGEECERCQWLGSGACTAGLDTTRDYIWTRHRHICGDCPICMNSLNTGTELKYQCGVCKTTFHYRCRKDWGRAITYQRCPTCRAGVPLQNILD